MPLIPQKTFAQHSQEYIKQLTEIFQSFDHRTLEKIIEILEEAYQSEQSVYFAGNGGSASTCGHFINDLNAVFLKLGTRAMNLFDLTANTATVTALANDTGYENIFLNQIANRIKPGDILMVISASGNSLNLIKAGEHAQKIKAKVIGFLGFDGGSLNDICDVAFIAHTPIGQYGPAEDIHLIISHLIASYLFLKFARETEMSDLAIKELVSFPLPLIAQGIKTNHENPDYRRRRIYRQ